MKWCFYCFTAIKNIFLISFPPNGDEGFNVSLKISVGSSMCSTRDSIISYLHDASAATGQRGMVTAARSLSKSIVLEATLDSYHLDDSP